jgi:flavin reductase (DIM6/NTAB) family NADH-FMN oxidoreductase RutF
MMDFKLINPRQTVLVSCRGTVDIFGKPTEKDNLIAVDWHMPLSFKQGMYGISIGKKKFSASLIRASKVFCVNFMQFSQSGKVLFCGRHSGQFIDKWKDTGLTKGEASKVDCPVIPDCCGWLECKVIQELDTGDHFTFIAEIVHTQLVDPDMERLFHTEGDSFGTVR